MEPDFVDPVPIEGHQILRISSPGGNHFIVRITCECGWAGKTHPIPAKVATLWGSHVLDTECGRVADY